MNREPDWETLAEINFLLYRRMAEHLNAALAAVNLIGAPEASDKPPDFWQERATTQMLNSLNLHNAWTSLVRYKMGETFLPQHMRNFRAADLLHWLAGELQLLNMPQPENDVLMAGNRETLQEALLLLRSCAYTLGPGVHLVVDSQDNGMWFRIRYSKIHKANPSTLDELLETLRNNWRAQGAAFELRRARDFLAMNDCELVYAVGMKECELAFFIYAIDQKPETTGGEAQKPLIASVPVQSDATTKDLGEADSGSIASFGETPSSSAVDSALSNLQNQATTVPTPPTAQPPSTPKASPGNAGQPATGSSE